MACHVMVICAKNEIGDPNKKISKCRCQNKYILNHTKKKKEGKW